MLQTFFHAWERRLASVSTDRVVRPFDWGLEWIPQNGQPHQDPGDTLRAGQRYGLIRFGSRTDLVLPRGTELRVRVGDRVRGGESVMGVLR